MLYKLRDIITDVRVAMNAHHRTEGLYAIDDETTAMLDEAITARVEQCGNALIDQAPVQMLWPGRDFSDGVHTSEDGYKGDVLLPADFRRLLSFKMSDWEHGVSMITPEGTDAYDMLYSEVEGVRANPRYPAVTIGADGAGLYLRYYGSESMEAEVEQAQYVANVKLKAVEGEMYADIPQAIYKTMIDAIAQALGVVQASLMKEQ